MKHLDEGTLQAWLDGRRSGLDQAELDAIGRHVDDCDVCTERVAALRASTERAASLLDTGAAVGPPPFAAVQARAASAEGGSEEGGSDARPASARPTAGRPRWRWQSASWAASVAVALGAGWLANDLYRRPGGGGGAMAAADAVVVGESEESVGSRQRAADLDVANDAGAASIEMPPPPSPSAPAEIAEGPVVDAPAPQTAEGPVVVAETEERGDRLETAPDAAVGARSAEAAMSAREPAARPAAEAPRPGVIEAERAADLVPVRGRVVDASSGRPLESAQVSIPTTQEGALTDAQGRFTLFVDSALTARTDELALNVQLIGYGETVRPLSVLLSDTAPADIPLSSTALRLQELVVSGEFAPQPPQAAELERATARRVGDWRTVTRDRAEGVAGFAPLTVPEQQVLSIEIGGDNPAVVRVVQALDGGGRLTLLQSFERETAEAEAAADLGVAESDDRAGALRSRTVQFGDVWVTGLAPLSNEALDALLSRLR